MPSKSVGEETLALHLKAAGISFTREFKFHPNRKWRADFLIDGTMLLVEVEGVVYGDKKGRHQTGQGFEKDLEKYSAAMLEGYMIYRCSPAMVRSGQALQSIEQLILM